METIEFSYDQSGSTSDPTSVDLSKRLESDSTGGNDFSDAILKYINQALMEDDLEDNEACKIQDSTLDAAEKSLYEILNNKKDIPNSFVVPYQPILPHEDSLARGRRKNLHREEEEEEESTTDLEEGRSKKHLAEEYSVLHEMFDKVLSFYDGEKNDDGSECSQQKEPAKEATGRRKKEEVDLILLLIQCMQHITINDQENASILLKEIKLRSSPWGDGSQRLAHYFAYGLEARLVGVSGGGILKHKSLDVKMSDADTLRSYKMYLSAFPFAESAFFFSDQVIMNLAENATSLHIINFGILFGFQWPSLIQRLSARPGGPPKLRITGIDLPQSDSFRQGTRVKETGIRLANCCQRYNVPFEYKGFVQQWETVSIEDLKIEKNEPLVVNCFYHLMLLLDETTIMEEGCPRDAVLELIRRINPDVFMHGIVNGNYSSPFFVSRFREAVFHFSALFDMLDTNLARDSRERMVFERDILGNEFLNVVVCEGVDRVVRPETYKQWQNRTLRAGFKQIPLNQEIIKEVRTKVKLRYHKDFFVDEADHWMLIGWKGRVISAFSCWKTL